MHRHPSPFHRPGSCPAPRRLARALLPCAVAMFTPVTVAAPDAGLTVGGAIRFNYTYKDWDPAYRSGGLIDFDTARIDVNYDRDAWLGSFQYRYYRYRGGADTHFLHHAWIGYRFDDSTQVHAGVNPIPFGILPFASHNFYFSLPYYVGLEDSYNLGVKLIHRAGPLDLQAGFYPSDGGNWRGDSDDSARYTYNIVEEGAVRNSERNTFVARAAWTMEHAPSMKSEFGLSALHGSIPNADTGRKGHREAWALHLKGDYGPWGVMLQTGRYDNSLRNPAGQDDRIVVMGAYDFPYEVAARARMHVANLSYRVQQDAGLLKSVTLYANYSVIEKLDTGFRDTHQQVYGFSFAPVDGIFVYVDYLLGKQNPYVGPNFGNGLAGGGTDDSWHERFNVNVGYYF
jgi:hypothetical protein